MVVVVAYNYCSSINRLQELIAWGEVVGAESRGLWADKIAYLHSIDYQSANTEEGEAAS